MWIASKGLEGRGRAFTTGAAATTHSARVEKETVEEMEIEMEIGHDNGTQI